MQVKLVHHDGENTIEVDGKPIDALAFKSFRPSKVNVPAFYAAGVRLFNIISTGLCSAYGMPYSEYGESWLGEGVYDFSAVDRQIEFFIEHAPEAYLLLNFHLDTRPWFLREHEDAVDSYRCLSQVAALEAWRASAADYIHALLTHVEQTHGDRVIGYVLLGGHTTEWFSDFDYEAPHPVKLAAYRAYLRDPNAQIPGKERLERPREQAFLDPVRDRDVISYRKFHNELIADTVLFFAQKAQAVLNHRKLVGVFFGYILELLGARLWNAGHLCIDRVYASEDIDIVATPSSYQFRKHSDAGAYMLMLNTLALHRKLYFISFDHRTYLYSDRVDGYPVPSAGVVLQNPREVADVMRREMMQRLVNRAGHWWFDMFGGWFDEPVLMQEVKRLTSLSNALRTRQMHGASEIAVFLDCDSFYYVNKQSDLNTFLLCDQRDGLARMGAPYDIFSMGDIGRVDLSSYKLCIFPCAFHVSADMRRMISERVAQNGRHLLFLYAPGYVGEEGNDASGIASLLGMRVEPLEGEETFIEAFGSRYGAYTHAVTPSFAVVDAHAEAYGRYAQSGKTGLACRKGETHTVWFSGLGNLTGAVLREIARKAGVHIYTQGDTVLFANDCLTGIYWPVPAHIDVTLREEGEYVELFSGQRLWAPNGRVTLDTTDSSAKLLLKVRCDKDGI